MTCEFYFGCMKAGKSKTLIEIAKSERRCGKKVVVAKPEVAQRDGKFVVCRKPGVCTESLPVDAFIERNCFSFEGDWELLLIDECQFLSCEQIEFLICLCLHEKKRIGFFGLLRSQSGKMFAGSEALFWDREVRKIHLPAWCEKCEEKYAVASFPFNDKGFEFFEFENVEDGITKYYMNFCEDCVLALKERQRNLVKEMKNLKLFDDYVDGRKNGEKRVKFV